MKNIQIQAVLTQVRDEILKDMKEDGFYLNKELRHDPLPWDINIGGEFYDYDEIKDILND